MTGLDRVFLDANVLFSAAYGSRLRALWARAEAGRHLLMASMYVVEEARRNLDALAQGQLLDDLVAGVRIVPEAPAGLVCPIALPPKDRPVFLAAWSAGATHLLTGDRAHFGAHFGSRVQGVRILPPALYLKGLPMGE